MTFPDLRHEQFHRKILPHHELKLVELLLPDIKKYFQTLLLPEIGLHVPQRQIDQIHFATDKTWRMILRSCPFFQFPVNNTSIVISWPLYTQKPVLLSSNMEMYHHFTNIVWKLHNFPTSGMKLNFDFVKTIVGQRNIFWVWWSVCMHFAWNACNDYERKCFAFWLQQIDTLLYLNIGRYCWFLQVLAP